MDLKLLDDMFKIAKKDKRHFLALKKLAVKTQQFELATQLRELEKVLFPETEEEILAKSEAVKLNLAFRMVDLNINEPTCWLISETLKKYSELKGEFSIREASELIVKCRNIFDND